MAAGLCNAPRVRRAAVRGGVALIFHAATFHAATAAASEDVEAPSSEPGIHASTDKGRTESRTAESEAVESGAVESRGATESETVESETAKSGAAQRTVFGRPIAREGFHFHASLGTGGGPDTVGLYHAMEIGGSIHGYTISLLHTFLQNKGVYGTTKGGPDEIGGFMLQVAGPLYFQDLVWKLATGVGGTVDQPEGEFNPNPGFGVHYGVDLHFPVARSWGPTLSLAGLNVVERGNHHFAVVTALGITFF